jgi:4-amino-4-deoxy-L-arabinose transferase-like glycosyltransferase
MAHSPIAPAPETSARPRSFCWILAFAAILRFVALGHKQLWLDEVIQAIHTSPQLSLRQVLTGVTYDRGAAPLDYLIQHYLVRLIGPSTYNLRLQAAFFGTFTVIVLYVLVQRLLGRNIALISAALYAVYPLHHHYSQEARPYALFTLLTASSYLCFWNLLKSGRRRDWIAYAVVTTLMLYSHYYGAFVMFSQAAFSFALLSGGLRQTVAEIRSVDFQFLAALTGVSALAAALFAPWPILASRTIFGYQPEPVHFGYKLALSFVQQLGDGSFPLALILIALAVLGANKLAAENQTRRLWFLLCWFALPIPFMFLLLWIKDYFFAIRQFLFLTPALIILAAVGVARLAELWAGADILQRHKKADLITALVATVSLVVIGLHVPDRREDLRGAGLFLRQNVTASDVVIAPQLSGVLAYYFPEIDQHAHPAADLAGLVGAAPPSMIFIVKSAYVSAADRQLIDTAVAKAPGARRIEFRDIEIVEIGSLRQ